MNETKKRSPINGPVMTSSENIINFPTVKALKNNFDHSLFLYNLSHEVELKQNCKFTASLYHVKYVNFKICRKSYFISFTKSIGNIHNKLALGTFPIGSNLAYVSESSLVIGIGHN